MEATLDTPTYDSTIDTKMHIAKVQQAIKRLTDVLRQRAQACSAHRPILVKIAYVLGLRSEVHDQSKLDGIEKKAFDEVTPKLAKTTYGSKEFDRLKGEIKPALDNHYKENRHHPEHFTNGILDMCLVDICEMFCDWAASTERHGDGDIHKSIEINKKRFKYDDTLARIFHNTSRTLKIGKHHNDGVVYKGKVGCYKIEDFGRGIDGMSLSSLCELFVYWMQDAPTERIPGKPFPIRGYIKTKCEEAEAGPIITAIFLNSVHELGLEL